MAGSLTNYARRAVVKHITKEAAYTPVSPLYFALCSSHPGATATGASMNEITGTGYARVTLGSNAVFTSAASSRTLTSGASVTFPTSGGSWNSGSAIGGWAIVDSGTIGAGNVLATGDFSVTKTINASGSTLTINSGQVSITVTASTGIGTDAANKLLNMLFRNTAWTVSANYLGLATTSITDATTSGTVVEPSGGSYARFAINVSGGAAPSWDATGTTLTDSTVENANDWGWGVNSQAAPSAAWGTTNHSFISDVSSGAGDILLYAPLVQTVGISDIVKFATGRFVFTQQ